jgi:transcription antitermination protein NusB
MRVESRARARALQALYAWELRGSQDLGRIANELFDDLIVGEEERRIASQLLQTAREHLTELDGELSSVTTNWRLDRVGVVERCALRLGAAELYRGETPPRVILREAIRLAERYGSPDSAKFVNGVLDALARKMGRL